MSYARRTILSFGTVSLVCATLFATAAFGQEETERKWNFNFGGGYTPPTGLTSDRLESGGNAVVGGGYNLNSHLGIVGEFQYNALGVASTALNVLSVPGGDAHIWSLTANPTFRMKIAPRVTGYVIGGGGVYRRTVSFNQPTTADMTVLDPWWGYTGSQFVPAGQTLGTVTSTAPGFDIGGGLTFAVGKTGAKIYVESRYNRAFTAGSDTTYAPVNFGVRW